jgi:hypothetical protein
MRRSFVFLLSCFVASLVVGSYGADLQAQCDNKCRRRFDFFLCNGGVANCIHYSVNTCEWCVFDGGCTNKDIDRGTNCADTLPSPTSVPAYYFGPCTEACTCPNYSTWLETLDTGGDTNPLALNIKVCR